MRSMCALWSAGCGVVWGSGGEREAGAVRYKLKCRSSVPSVYFK